MVGQSTSAAGEGCYSLPMSKDRGSSPCCAQAAERISEGAGGAEWKKVLGADYEALAKHGSRSIPNASGSKTGPAKWSVPCAKPAAGQVTLHEVVFDFFEQPLFRRTIVHRQSLTQLFE